MDFGIAGKSALITGASQGIGLAIARNIALEGCNIAICARNRDRLEQAAAGLRNHSVFYSDIPTDVLKPDNIRESIDRTLQDLS